MVAPRLAKKAHLLATWGTHSLCMLVTQDRPACSGTPERRGWPPSRLPNCKKIASPSRVLYSKAARPLPANFGRCQPAV